MSSNLSPGASSARAGALVLLLVLAGGGRPLPARDLGAAAAAAAAPRPDASFVAAPLALRAQGIESSLALLSHFVEPSQAIEIEAAAGSGAGPFAARADVGTLEPLGPGRWRWRAPAEPGHALVEVVDRADGEVRRLRLFVLTPYDGGATLGGYRIGAYPRERFRGLATYERPRGFVAVAPGDLKLPLSPHFALGQFLCKQDAPRASEVPGGVRYVALRTELLVALERLLAEVRAHGIEAESFTVMSGYRTPEYNAAIGNDTIYSRHTYGDAADVFVDRDGDGRMDDLDGDGRVDARDARVLFNLAERLAQREIAAGGLGLYGPKPHRGPFLHLDTRGYPARWGV